MDFAVHLMKGYWVFWILLPTTATVLILFQRIFRMDLYSHSDAYIISGIVFSSVLQAGWSAFAALSVKEFARGEPVWLTVMFYITGVVSCYVTFGLVSAYYTGTLYRFVNLPLGVGTFALFSFWPATGRVTYGWFFDLF